MKTKLSITGRLFFSLRLSLKMAIKRHNRTIWILAGIIFLLVLVFLFRDGQLENIISRNSKPSETGEAGAGAEQFGDKVGELMQDTSQKAESKKKLALALEKMGACFQMQGSPLEMPPLQIESLYQKFQTELGPVAHQADRWMDWHLRAPDGRERRLRLEITETDEGKVGRELHYFSVSRDGQPSPLEMEPGKADNPSDEVINQMLKEGEVFYKERAAVSFFSNGEHVEYIEKNGDLSEIVFFKESRHFRCPDILVPETCQCI